MKGAKPVSIFLVLPVDRLTTYNRWLRLIVALGIADIARTPAKPPKPVLFILDEFAQLGRLKIIEDAFSLMAGLGLQLHIIVQDFAKMEEIYGKGWFTFIANCGVIQLFNARDLYTAETISKMLGVTTQSLRSESYSSSSGQGGGSSSSSVNFALTQRPLVFPDELMRMDRTAQILFVEGANPVLGDKIVWYEDEILKALVAATPVALTHEPVAPVAVAPKLHAPSLTLSRVDRVLRAIPWPSHRKSRMRSARPS